MELEEFVITACKGRTAIELKPRKQLKLDLTEIAKRLKNNRVKVEIETPILLLLNHNNHDITLSKSGKLLVKGTKDQAIAKTVASAIVEAI